MNPAPGDTEQGSVDALICAEYSARTAAAGVTGIPPASYGAIYDPDPVAASDAACAAHLLRPLHLQRALHRLRARRIVGGGLGSYYIGRDEGARPTEGGS